VDAVSVPVLALTPRERYAGRFGTLLTANARPVKAEIAGSKPLGRATELRPDRLGAPGPAR
jgi:hypothetical protein